MKKSKYLYTIILIISFPQFMYSQENQINYFNHNEFYSISVYNPSSNNSANGHIKFDFSEIWTSNNLLDIAVISNILYNEYFYRYGHYNINWSFAQPYLFSYSPDMYYYEFRPDDSYQMKDVLFVKLRDGNFPKDVVIMRGDGTVGSLQVHINSNNAILPNPTYIPYAGGNNIDAGAFTSDDNREDICLTNGNQIKIFKNIGDGTLYQTPWIFSYSADKVKLKQISDKNRIEIQFNLNDKADLIMYKNEYNPERTRILVYKNNNNNGFEQTPLADFYVNYHVTDMEVSSINGDDYNDIILLGDNIGQAYLGGPDVVITTPYWTYQGEIGNSPNVAIADLNKDGVNDIITLDNEGYLCDFVSPYFENLNERFCVLCIPDYYTDNCIKAVDINSTGETSILFSFNGNYLGAYNYGIFGVKPAILNPPPAPPAIYAKTEFYNGAYRPRIELYNRGERDFDHYQIWKLKRGWENPILIVSNLTNNYYIDENEVVVFGGEDIGIQNCFYSANSVDISNYISINSNSIGYTVAPDITCDNCSGDNSIIGKGKNFNMMSKDYSINNYPNPFNPKTKIVYSIPNSGYVNVTVFNSIGQVIKTLINEYKYTGSYIIEFDGSNLASGIYFYKITSGKYTEVRKMLLIK